ncbi:MAG: hypothetical protein ABIQ49_09560 [Gemmatimonadales bacterium]
MMQPSSAAIDVARRLWAHENDVGSTTPAEVAAGAARVLARLDLTLGRWVGADGVRALRSRGVALARPAHPALAALAQAAGDEEVAAAVRTYGPEAVATGIVAVVATVTDLLGRIVGEQMAVRLVELTGTAPPASDAQREHEGGSNG